MYAKEIVFDRETRDFACYLDGELIAFARTRLEAEQTLNELVYELLANGYAPPAAEVAEQALEERAQQGTDAAALACAGIEPPYYIANTDSDDAPVVVENGTRVVARPGSTEAAAALAAELNRPWQTWQDERYSLVRR